MCVRESAIRGALKEFRDGCECTAVALAPVVFIFGRWLASHPRLFRDQFSVVPVVKGSCDKIVEFTGHDKFWLITLEFPDILVFMFKPLIVLHFVQCLSVARGNKEDAAGNYRLPNPGKKKLNSETGERWTSMQLKKIVMVFLSIFYFICWCACKWL